MLILPIKKKWFDMIIAGEKKEEYREISDYYESRFADLYYHSLEFNENALRPRFNVIFRNGYSKKSPSIRCEVEVSIGYGKPEWGAEPKKQYFVLQILSIERIN